MKFFSSYPSYRPIVRRIVAGALMVTPLAFAAVATAQVNDIETEPETLSTPVEPPNDSGAYAAIAKLPESLRRSAPFARNYYEFERRAGTSGVIDWDAYFAAYKKAQKDRERELGIAYKRAQPLNTWKNVGVSGTSPVSYSAGCTVAIAFDPTNADIMYVGAQGGGVWKSMDHGASWVPLTDYALPDLTVASIAVDPHNASTVWVGTGECNSGEPNYGGSGLWRSKDGGASWERIDLGSKSVGPSFVKVVVDPGTSDVVLVSSYDGTSRGLYRTQDGGGTWTKVFSTSGEVWDVVPGKIEGGQQTYFLVEGHSSKAGIYKSTDDGLTWNALSSTAIPAPNQIGRSVLAVASASPDKVFCLMSSSSIGDSLAFVSSADAGATWSARSLPNALFKSPYSNFAPQGWYDICLAVNPSGMPIYIGGVQAFVDYGQGWQIWSGYGDQLKGNPHVDHHALAIDPRDANVIFNGNDGGLYISNDAGHSWSYRSSGMVTNRIYRIAFERVSQSVWAGAQDQGTWRLSNAAANGNDTSFFGGDGFQPIPYPVSSIIMYYELPYGEVHRSKDYRSDGGTPLITNELAGDQAYWDAPLKMSLVGHGTTNSYDLLYLGRQNLWRSTDGTTFKKVPNASFGNYPYITALALSPINSDVIAFGGPGKIMTSIDFGATWQSKSTGIPGAPTSSIALTGRNPQFMIASFRTSGANHVMVSHDFGSSWTAVSGNGNNTLPGVGVESIALDSTAPESTWYASTNVGVYFTTDAGQNWHIAAGLPLVACRDLQLRKDGAVLRVATFGRGVWESNLPLEAGQGAVGDPILQALKTDNGTELSWKITGDPDGRTFEVQRSIADNGFEKIGEVAEAGVRSFNFTDPTRTSGTYSFRIASVDPSGARAYSNIVEVTYGSNALIVHDPRPNPMTRGEALAINYELPSRQPVTITIFNLTGVKIATITDGNVREPGSYTQEWDGRDASGNLVAAGTYLFQISAGDAGNYTGRFIIR